MSNLLFSRVVLSRSSADFVSPVLPENVSNLEPSVLPNVSNRWPKSGGELARSFAMSRLKRLPIVSSRSPKILSVLNRLTFKLDVFEFDRECPSRRKLNSLSFGLAFGLTDGTDEAIDWMSGFGLWLGSTSSTIVNVGITGCSFSSCWTLCKQETSQLMSQSKFNWKMRNSPSYLLNHLEELCFAFTTSTLLIFLLECVSNFKFCLERIPFELTLLTLFWNKLVICPFLSVWTNSLAAWCGETRSTQLMKRYNF